MSWYLPLAVALGAGIVTSQTDWIFAGDWIHRRWTYPEVWRVGVEPRAIALTAPLPVLTSVVFIYAAWRLGLHSYSANLKFACAVWLMGPLPMMLTNAAFMKLHRAFVALHTVGWLVKLLIIGAAAGWLLR